MEKLDKLDQGILAILSENCRIPNSRIAKIMHVSEPHIKYRIERLEKEGIIQRYYTLINFSAVGSTFYMVCFLKIKKTRLEEIKKVIEYVKNNPYVIGVTEYDGDWNLSLRISTSSKIDLIELLNEVQRLSGPYMEDLRVFITCWHLSINRHPFMSSESIKLLQKKIVPFKNDSSFQKDFAKRTTLVRGIMQQLDSTDFKILSALRNDARASLVQLANVTKLNVQTVKQRIQNLIEKSVIGYFMADIDYTKLGYKEMAIFMNILSDDKKRKTFFAYLEKFPSIFTALTYMDYWNFSFILRFKTLPEADEILEDILANFKDLILDYKKLIEVNEHKKEMYNSNLEEVYSKAVSFFKGVP